MVMTNEECQIDSGVGPDGVVTTYETVRPGGTLAMPTDTQCIGFDAIMGLSQAAHINSSPTPPNPGFPEIMDTTCQHRRSAGFLTVWDDLPGACNEYLPDTIGVVCTCPARLANGLGR